MKQMHRRIEHARLNGVRNKRVPDLQDFPTLGNKPFGTENRLRLCRSKVTG